MLRSVCLSVCLSHAPISSKRCILRLWLLNNTNRKPHGGSLLELTSQRDSTATGRGRKSNRDVVGAAVAIFSTAFDRGCDRCALRLLSEAFAR